VDVAIVMDNRLLTTSSEMLVDLLYEEPIQVLMAADHPLAQHERVPWSELVRYSQVVFKDGYGMQRLVQERFSKLGATLQAVMELNTLEAFRGVVRQGELVALLPRSALIEAQTDPTLAVRAIGNFSTPDENLMRQVVLVTTHDRMQIPPIQYFCQLVRQSDVQLHSIWTQQKVICETPSVISY
jgi:DNA-binding transcriptional LysR family regulator